MATLNISLTPELEQFVESRVKSGHYQTNSEVMRAGLRLLIEQEQLRNLRRENLRTLVGEGLMDLEQGNAIPAEEAHAELNRRREERAKRR